jgi:hypothetical protein
VSLGDQLCCNQVQLTKVFKKNSGIQKLRPSVQHIVCNGGLQVAKVIMI